MVSESKARARTGRQVRLGDPIVPCTACGTLGGKAQPGCSRSTRNDGARFGVAGVLCLRCYEVLRGRARRGVQDPLSMGLGHLPGSVEPCADCGTTAGKARSGTGGRPARWSGRLFGIEGRLCGACYNHRHSARQRERLDAAPPLTPDEARHLAWAALGVLAAKGDAMEDKRCRAIDRGPVGAASPSRGALLARRAFRASLFGGPPEAWVTRASAPPTPAAVAAARQREQVRTWCEADRGKAEKGVEA